MNIQYKSYELLSKLNNKITDTLFFSQFILFHKSANYNFSINFGGIKAVGGLNHCALVVLSSRKISQWQLANVVSHCLVSHINRDTHTLVHLRKMPGMEPFPSLCAGGFCACVCVSETRWGSDPLSQHHANTSSPCASWQLLCVRYKLLVWLFSRTHKHTRAVTHCIMLTHDPVAMPDQTHTFVRTM